METENPYSSQPYGSESAALQVTSEMRHYLFETAKWGKFLSIVGFILVGLMVVGAFTFGTLMTTMMGNYTYNENLGSSPLAAGGMGIMMTIYFLLFALLYFFPTLYLYQFSFRTKRALQENHEIDLAFAFSRLKSFFKFWGILIIIFMGFYALGLVAMMIGFFIGR